jgi:hypothetical protein
VGKDLSGGEGGAVDDHLLAAEDFGIQDTGNWVFQFFSSSTLRRSPWERLKIGGKRLLLARGIFVHFETTLLRVV